MQMVSAAFTICIRPFYLGPRHRRNLRKSDTCEDSGPLTAIPQTEGSCAVSIAAPQIPIEMSAAFTICIRPFYLGPPASAKSSKIRYVRGFGSTDGNTADPLADAAKAIASTEQTVRWFQKATRRQPTPHD